MKSLENLIINANNLNSQIITLNQSLINHCEHIKNHSSNFEERVVEYETTYGLGKLGEKIDNKLCLISLICSFVLIARKNNPNVTVLECVKKLTDYESLDYVSKNDELVKFYENLAIVSESFLYGVSEGNTFGLKNAKEVKDKILEIINTRLPF